MSITCLEGNLASLTKKDDQYNSRLFYFNYSHTHTQNQYRVINLIRIETQRLKITQIAMNFL
jgi:hypothetical protein